ncbi:MAG: MFS transporter [Clostridia bacterium]
MKNRNRSVIAISLITALCLTGDSMIYLILPLYWQKLGLGSLVEVGILLSINRLVRLPLGPMVGWLLQAISVKRGLLLAVLLAAFTTTAYGFATGFWVWLGLRALWGFTWSLLRLGALFLIADVSLKHEHGKNMGTYNGLYRLGSLCGMLLGAILAEGWGLQPTAALFGLMAFASLLLLPWIPASTRKDKPATAATHQQRSLWGLLNQRGTLLVAATGLLTAMLYQGVITSTLSRAVSNRFDSGLDLFGFWIGAVTLAGLLSAVRWMWEPFLAPLVGRSSDTPGRSKRMMAVTLFCAAPLFALIPSSIPDLLWLCAILALQMTATAITTLADAAASRMAAGLSAGAVFLTSYSVLVDIGAAVGPLLGYLLPVEWLYPLCGVILCGMALSWVKAKSRKTAANNLSLP